MPALADVLPLLPWLLPLPALLALSLSTLNLLVWPRGRPGGGRLSSVSVCIPARNEAVSIEACVTAALALGADEVIVLDDGSTDDTPAILARLSTGRADLRVVRLDAALPEGWVGKVRACWVLASLAHSEHLLFIDADVVVEPDALQRFADLRTRYAADVITAVPRQVTVGFVEKLVLPLLHLTYTSWLPLPLIWRTRDPRFLAANGQLLFMSRAALDDVGGFKSVRAEIVDDMALCRVMKRAGKRVVFADGDLLGRCRMYRSPRAVIDGFSKNLYEGLGSLVGLVGVVGWYAWAFVIPLLCLPFAALQVPAVVGVVAALALRLMHAWRHHSSVLSAVFNPVGVCVLLAIAVRSWWWSRRGTIQWAGRIYPARNKRAVPT